MAERFVDAVGRGDHAALRGLYDPEIAFYSPVAWGLRGVQPLVDFVVGDTNFGLPRLLLTDWRLPLPEDTPDPDPVRG
jgi:hypothetical protein